MRHPNVRNADELEIREMIKGRHNMRLRQLGKPAGSRALGATLTEVAPGAISFPATPIMPTRRRSTSSLVPARHGSTRPASPCVRETGSRCRRAPRMRTRWSTLQQPNRSSISASRRCTGSRSSSIPILEKSASVLPIRQARLASAASASSGPEAARSITGRASLRRVPASALNQTDSTEPTEMPMALAIARQVQWVAPSQARGRLWCGGTMRDCRRTLGR